MKKLTFLLALLSLFSCRKNKIDYSRLIVAEYDIVDVQYQKILIDGSVAAPEKMLLDLDQDGTWDLELYSKSTLTIRNLHEGCQFLVQTSEDSVFFKESWQVQADPNGTIASLHLTNYSCRRENEQYVFDTIVEHEELMPLVEGDRFDRVDNYASGTYNFKRSAEEANSEVYTQNDTTFYNINTYEGNCHQFPAQDIRYIGVLLQTSNGQKLGWVKVQYLGSNKVRVFECAIQR